MKKLIIAAAALLGLAGCVAIPAPYAGDAYYYPAPAVGVYAAPVHGYGYGYRHPRPHTRSYH